MDGVDMARGDRRASELSETVTAVGVDHVRLSYLYVDEGDLDGFSSLLHDDVWISRPDVLPGRGRDEVLKLLKPVTGPPGVHHVHRVIADGDCVAVLGRFTRTFPDARADREFADFFTLSDEGLLLGCRRFYSSASG